MPLPPNPPVAPPPWEALPLVAQALDPKSLALASCVSKSWHAAMSADHLWRPFLLARYPSSLHLPHATNPISHRALFALLRSASPHRRLRDRLTPRIFLNDLVFIVDVFRADGSAVLSLAKPGEDMNPTGVFHFDVEVRGGREIVGAVEELTAAWTVVLKGCRGAFAMMERGGRGRPIGTSAVWFSEELPGLACCSASGGASMMAELGLEFCRRGDEQEKTRVGIERVRMGLMGVVGCRYMGLDDGLLYLQSFLLPPSF